VHTATITMCGSELRYKGSSCVCGAAEFEVARSCNLWCCACVSLVVVIKMQMFFFAVVRHAKERHDSVILCSCACRLLVVLIRLQLFCLPAVLHHASIGGFDARMAERSSTQWVLPHGEAIWSKEHRYLERAVHMY